MVRSAFRHDGGFDEYDDDTLEAIDLVSDEPSASAPLAHTRARRRARTRRSTRLRATAVVLAMLSIASFGAALHARDVATEVRAIEEHWRTAVVVDADRARAVGAIDDAIARFGPADDLFERLDDVIDAADARLEKLASELQQAHVSTSTARELRDSMLGSIDATRDDVLRDRSPALRSAPVSAELDRTLRRWRAAARHPEGVALTTAHETIERLARFADEPTGIVAVALTRRADALFAIDVDRGRVSRLVVDAGANAYLTRADDAVLLIDGGLTRAFRYRSDSLELAWERTVEAEPPVEVGVPAVVVTPIDPPPVASRRPRPPRPAPAAGIEGSPPATRWTVSVERGRLFVATGDLRERSVLRAPLPAMRDVVVLPAR